MPERLRAHRSTFTSDPLRLREARRWLTGIARDAGLAREDVDALAVAFSEATSNLHRHAYGGRRDGRVDVGVAIARDRATVTLEHEGTPFDPAAYTPPDLQRPAESGYGLYLIESLVDDVSFENTGRGGRVTLVKLRREVAPASTRARQGVVMSETNREPESQEAAGDVLPDLAELCRIHEIGLDLIGRSDDLEELLDRVLDEYEARLSVLPNDALDPRSRAPNADSVRKLRGLVMFATQAAALKEKAVANAELKRRAAMLEQANKRLSAALDEARQSHARLDGVLAALSSGVMIFDSGATLFTANAAARELAGTADDAALARLLLQSVPKGGEAEIELHGRGGARRTLLATRRSMSSGAGSEVVLITDVTERNRAVEERVRLEKLAEALKTLSVLSHKINNPLTALLGRAQILQAQKSGDPGVAKAAAVIEEASMRIAGLIRELAQVVKDGRQDAVDELLDMSGTRAGTESHS